MPLVARNVIIRSPRPESGIAEPRKMMVSDDRQMAASLDRREGRRKRSDWAREAAAWCLVGR